MPPAGDLHHPGGLHGRQGDGGGPAPGGPQPTREKLIAALETMGDYDLGGVSVRYSPTSHIGSRFTELTIVGRDVLQLFR